MNNFLDLQVHLESDVQEPDEPAIEADTGVVNQQLMHKLAYANFTALCKLYLCIPLIYSSCVVCERGFFHLQSSRDFC
jgi:hypothetical protein